MEIQQFIVVLIGVLAASTAGALWYYLRFITNLPQDITQGLLAPSTEKTDHPGKDSGYDEEDFTVASKDLDKIKKITASRKVVRGRKENLRNKFFKAGYFSRKQIENFVIFQIFFFFASLISIPCFVWFTTNNTVYSSIAIVLGIVIGLLYPLAKLDRLIEKRKEKIHFYLPLVIEQIAIGVSSSLVVAACVTNVVKMAKERSTNNPVVDLFRQVERLVQTGYSFENAMTQISDVMAMPVIEHTFSYLVQCSKHGGEISKQLQELANATMVERNIKIQGKISGLPAEATAPLGLVFGGFFLILLGGIFIQMFTALQMR